jgi:hypothetical protein
MNIEYLIILLISVVCFFILKRIHNNISSSKPIEVRVNEVYISKNKVDLVHVLYYNHRDSSVVVHNYKRYYSIPLEKFNEEYKLYHS